ncbi:hypothetical protein [Deferribacter abyssi]|uniref:hypothetical protein n=1 Tax=Deferribacter abyssi TaxID=213806 RepID=UPI003C1CCE08
MFKKDFFSMQKLGIEDVLFISAIALFIVISFFKVNDFLLVNRVPRYFSNMKLKNLIFGDDALKKISLLFGNHDFQKNAYIAEYEGENTKVTVICAEFESRDQLFDFAKRLISRLHIGWGNLNDTGEIRWVKREMFYGKSLYFYIFTKKNKIFLLTSNRPIGSGGLNESYQIFE